jgi:hypothetical protein
MADRAIPAAMQSRTSAAPSTPTAAIHARVCSGHSPSCAQMRAKGRWARTQAPTSP